MTAPTTKEELLPCPTPEDAQEALDSLWKAANSVSQMPLKVDYETLQARICRTPPAPQPVIADSASTEAGGGMGDAEIDRLEHGDFTVWERDDLYIFARALEAHLASKREGEAAGYPDFRPQLSKLYEAVEYLTETGNGEESVERAMHDAFTALAMDAHDASIRYAAHQPAKQVAESSDVPEPITHIIGMKPYSPQVFEGYPEPEKATGSGELPELPELNPSCFTGGVAMTSVDRAKQYATDYARQAIAQCGVRTAPQPDAAGLPELRELSEEELELLHYNPNTDDVVAFVRAYAQQAVAQKDAEIASLRDELKGFVSLAKLEEEDVAHLTKIHAEAEAEALLFKGKYSEAHAELTALREQAARDSELMKRWKKAAEATYGRFFYTDRPGLARGALDAWFENNKEWEPEFDAAVIEVLGNTIAKEQK